MRRLQEALGFDPGRVQSFRGRRVFYFCDGHGERVVCTGGVPTVGKVGERMSALPDWFAVRSHLARLKQLHGRILRVWEPGAS